MSLVWSLFTTKKFEYYPLVVITEVLSSILYFCFISFSKLPDFDIFARLFQEGKTIPFVETFSFIMHQYLQALSGIVPIFNYMVSSC